MLLFSAILLPQLSHLRQIISHRVADQMNLRAHRLGNARSRNLRQSCRDVQQLPKPCNEAVGDEVVDPIVGGKLHDDIALGRVDGLPIAEVTNGHVL